MRPGFAGAAAGRPHPTTGAAALVASGQGARFPDGRVELIQVAADASDPTTAARELRALAAAQEELPQAAAVLVTLTEDGLPAALPQGVKAKAAAEWFLTNE